MNEHRYFYQFSMKSFENAIRFRNAVEAGDYSHDCERYLSNKDGGIDYMVDRCLMLSTDEGTCIRMQMPGLCLLQYWSQAYCFVKDASGIWHSCWVDEEFNS